MKTDILTRLASLLQSGTCQSYSHACRILGACPDDLDELIFAELGVSGDTLFDSFGNPG